MTKQKDGLTKVKAKEFFPWDNAQGIRQKHHVFMSTAYAETKFILLATFSYFNDAVEFATKYQPLSKEAFTIVIEQEAVEDFFSRQ